MLGVRSSMATLNFLQTTPMQYLMISLSAMFTLSIFELESAVSFENLFTHSFQDTFCKMAYPFGQFYGRTYAQLSCKNRRTEDVFHLNYRLNVPLTFNENNTLKCVFS